MSSENGDEPQIEFAPQGKIDSRVDDLLKRLFDIDGAWVSDEATLDMYLDDFEERDDGHRLIPLSEVPVDDRAVYAEEFAHCREMYEWRVRRRRSKGESEDEDDPTKRFMVWYPRYTDEESEARWTKTRRDLLDRVEEAYGISIADFGDGELYVWQVADFIDRQLLNKLSVLREGITKEGTPDAE